MTTIVCPMLGSMMEAGLPVLAALIYVRESERIETTSPENLKPPYGPGSRSASGKRGCLGVPHLR